jgi:hypothetical protein
MKERVKMENRLGINLAMLEQQSNQVHAPKNVGLADIGNGSRLVTSGYHFHLSEL